MKWLHCVPDKQAFSKWIKAQQVITHTRLGNTTLIQSRLFWRSALALLVVKMTANRTKLVWRLYGKWRRVIVMMLLHNRIDGNSLHQQRSDTHNNVNCMTEKPSHNSLSSCVVELAKDDNRTTIFHIITAHTLNQFLSNYFIKFWLQGLTSYILWIKKLNTTHLIKILHSK